MPLYFFEVLFIKTSKFTSDLFYLKIGKFLFTVFIFSIMNVVLYIYNIGNIRIGINKSLEFVDSFYLFTYLFVNYFIVFFLSNIFLNIVTIFNVKILIFIKKILISILYSVFLIISFIDSFLYRVLGINVNDSVVIHAFKVGSIFKATNTNLWNMLLYFTIFTGITVIIFFIIKLLNKIVFITKKLPFLILLSTIFINYCFYIIFDIKNLEIIRITFFYKLTVVSNIDDFSIVNYKKNNTNIIENPKNIIIIISESLRGDIFTSDIMPNIYNFMSNHNCITSEKHYSGSHSTVPSIFSVLYGTESYYFNLFSKKDLSEFNKSQYVSTLINNDYNTIFINSSSIYYQYIYNNFSIHKEVENDPKLFDFFENTIKNISATKNLIVLFLNTSHYDYFFPKDRIKFNPIVTNTNSIFFKDARTVRKEFRHLLFNRYKNSAFFVDYLFNKIIEIASKKINIDDSIIVFIGDHGEEFWEKGFFGHVKVAFNNERITTPFMFCSKEILKKSVKLSSHFDIFPTVFDVMKVQNSNDLLNPNSGVSLLENHPNRFFTITNVNFPLEDKKLCLVSEYGKVVFNILSGTKKDPQIEILEYTDLDDNILQDMKKIEKLNKYLEEFKKNYMKYIRFK